MVWKLDISRTRSDLRIRNLHSPSTCSDRSTLRINDNYNVLSCEKWLINWSAISIAISGGNFVTNTTRYLRDTLSGFNSRYSATLFGIDSLTIFAARNPHNAGGAKLNKSADIFPLEIAILPARRQASRLVGEAFPSRRNSPRRGGKTPTGKNGSFCSPRVLQLALQISLQDRCRHTRIPFSRPRRVVSADKRAEECRAVCEGRGPSRGFALTPFQPAKRGKSGRRGRRLSTGASYRR